jgi:hypothetical protein
MRVRDYCRKSLEFLVQRNFVPNYQVSGPFARGAPRPSALFRPEQMILAHYAIAEGPLYANPATWEATYKYIKSFTATGVGAAAKNCLFSSWCGNFPDLDADDLLGLVTSALTQCGLNLKHRNDTARTASFEAVDDCKVSALPEPYGKYLQLVQHKAAWDNPVQLRLFVNVKAVALPAAPGAPFKTQSHIELETSTLTPTLMDSAARRLASALPTRLQRLQFNMPALSETAVLQESARRIGGAAPLVMYPVPRRPQPFKIP